MVDSIPPNPPHRPTPQENLKNTYKIHWPVIKIVQPRKGCSSPQTDERCFTYCSQSIAGRAHKREPWCRSICIRKVFAHEVQNVLGFASHRNVGPDGQAKYPLPTEGQPLPGENGPHRNHGKYWEEGWYLWFSTSRWAAVERIDLMSSDLDRQAIWLKMKEERRAQWEEWEKRQQMKPKDASKLESPLEAPGGWEEPAPAKPFPDTSGQSLLIRLPPPLPPIYNQVQTLLGPTYKVLDIFHQSFQSGAQLEFAGRVWDKAWTSEPFKLVTVVCSKMWEKWKEGPPDGTKGI